MKRYLAVLVVLCSTNAYAGDAEVITRGVTFAEEQGIMEINGEFKNNTSIDFNDFHVAIEFRRGNRVVHNLKISMGVLKAGEQTKIAHRTKGVAERWTNHRLSFYEGDAPLFWRAPRN